MALLLTAASSLAQTATLVRDLNTANRPDEASNPRGFTSLNGDLYFSAFTRDRGRELYCMPGGTGTPVPLRDGQPGTFLRNPDGLTAFKGKLLFTAQLRSGSTSLLLSDGTSKGTQVLAPSTQMSFDRPALVVGARAFYLTESPFNDHELMTTDGTAAGTYRVAKAGPVGRIAPRRDLARLGTGVVFSRDTANGVEPWFSDGSPAGTRMIVDLHPGSTASGPNSSNPRKFTAIGGNRVMFVADSATVRGGLWISDGSAAGTQLVADLGQRASEVTAFAPAAVVGGYLYFFEDSRSGKGLWRSDGTAAGTSFLWALPWGPAPDMVEWGGMLYLAGPQGNGSLFDLLRVDPGTAKVSRAALIYGRVHRLWTDGKRLLMYAQGGANSGSELWESSGTQASTKRVADINPGPGSSDIFGPLVVAAGVSVFSATDGKAGHEVWQSTAAGPTVLLADIGPHPSATLDATVRRLRARAGRVHGITAKSGPLQRPEVFVSDNQAKGTAILARAATQATRWIAPVELGAMTFFVGGEAQGGDALFVSRGTPASTRVLHRGLVVGMARLGGQVLVITKSSPSSGSARLWLSDGTQMRSFFLLPATSQSPQVTGTLAVDGRVFIGYWDHGGGGLWITDGTAQGTRFKDLSGVKPALVWTGPMLRCNGEVYCTAHTSAGLPAILIADAGGSKFRVLLDAQGNPQGLDRLAHEDLEAATAQLGGVLYFPRQEPGSHQRSVSVWRTDGTSAGTFSLGMLGQSSPRGPRRLVRMGPQVYALSFEGQKMGLWRTDGSASGTKLVRQLQLLSTPPDEGHDLLAVGDRLYFQAWDAQHGAELWTSDGTAQGTRRLLDLIPGYASGGASQLCLNRGQILFSARDQIYGLELFRVDPGAHSHSWGVACAPTGHVRPQLSSSPPRLGQRMQISAEGLGGQTLGALLIGLPVAHPVYLESGCSLYVDFAGPHLVNFFQPQQGRWSTSAQLPGTASLHGLDLCLQLGVGPSGQAPFGLSLSAGLWLALRR